MSKKVQSKKKKGATSVLLRTFVGTTWRMILPTISLAFLGVWADKMFSYAPWCTLLGMIIGFVISFFLVLSQMRALDKNRGGV